MPKVSCIADFVVFDILSAAQSGYMLSFEYNTDTEKESDCLMECVAHINMDLPEDFEGSIKMCKILYTNN